MQRTVFFTVLLIVYSFAGNGICIARDDFEELIRQGDRQFREMLEESEQTFRELRQVDEDFAAILDRAWRELELETGIDPDPVPKPETVPTARPDEEPVEEAEPPVREPSPPPPPPPEPVPPSTAVPGTELRFTFFNTPLSVTADETVFAGLAATPGEESISRAWREAGSSPYEPLLEQTRNLKESLGLNDWGYLLLLDSIARGSGPDVNDRTFFVWFMLTKAGYDVRAGYSGDLLYLLIPADGTVYNVPYFVMDSREYYLFSTDESAPPAKTVTTYEGSYENARRPFDFTLRSTPSLARDREDRALTFTFDGVSHTIPAAVNANLVGFYRRYPLTDLPVYFTAASSRETATPLLAGLGTIIDGFDQQTAVDCLLRFVQKSFAYATDDEQFGDEKPLFREETVYYPSSDCEDRSILFSYLVRELLGLDVVGLDYPGHVATAVRFTEPVEGDTVVVDGETYTICDPTYINAVAGECMPEFRNVTPGTIDLR